jgi:hypothetical protein
MKYLYSKINPYLVSYMFRLIFLELSLDIVLYLYCFAVDSKIGIASLSLALVDLIIVVLSVCWKVRTSSDGPQVALFYNN